MSKDEPNFFEALAILAVVPVLIVLRAIAFVALWGWYMVPMGCRQINNAQAVGISCLVSLLTYHGSPDESLPAWKLVGKNLFEIAVAVLVGWIAKFWL